MARMQVDTVDVPIDATPPERAALAAECDLVGLEALQGTLRVERDGARGIRVSGTVTARVERVCVVSLDVFASDVVEALDVRFAPDDEVQALAAQHASRPADEGEDEDLPDPIVNGSIDLGALVAEALVLGLDPHPRKPGVDFAEPAPPTLDETSSPFSALRILKADPEA